MATYTATQQLVAAHNSVNPSVSLRLEHCQFIAGYYLYVTHGTEYATRYFYKTLKAVCQAVNSRVLLLAYANA